MLSFNVLVVGWHNRLNTRASRGALDIYQMSEQLHGEAMYVNIQIVLADEERLTRDRRSTYRLLEQQLLDSWEQYDSKSIITSEFLSKCSYIYAGDFP